MLEHYIFKFSNRHIFKLKLPFQFIQETNVNCTGVAINHDNNSQPYSNFRRGYGHDKKYKNLTNGVRFIGRKGNKQQINGIEHQFNTHENNKGIATGQYAYDAYHKQRCCQQHVVLQWN